MSFERESSGRGDDWSIHTGEQSPFALDREWEEFNKHLGVDDPEQERLAVQQEVMRGALVWNLYDQLDARQVPRLLDEDADIEASRRQEFIECVYREKLADISWMRKDSDASLVYVDKALQSLMEYVRTAQVQRSVVVNAADILYGTMHGSILSAEKVKKSVQAELYVLHNVPLASEWMRFFDDVTPGCGIVSPSHPDDKPYIDAAQDAKQQFEDLRMYEKTVLETAIDLATYKNKPDFWGNTTEVACTLSAIAGLYAIATTNHGNGYGVAARRNQQLWHYGYTTGLDDQVLSEIIDYFELSNPDWEG